MEPRIATLLDAPYQDRVPYDPLVTPPSGTRRPPPGEPTSLGDDAFPQANGPPNDFKARYNYGIQSQGRTSSSRANPGAPIAQVLNNETPMFYASQPGTTVLASPTTPFSGRLGDLLLDSSEQANKRRKREQLPEQTAQVASENGVIKLPQPPQLPKKTTRRPRIPPLLQGLHQPPPLPPEGRLFPPITSEKNSFARSPGERVGFDTYEEARRKPEDAHIGSRPAAPDMNSATHNEKSVVENHTALQTSPPRTTSELDQTKELTSTEILDKSSNRTKSNRKRNKWSEQETKHLLLGVTKYGIGNWKKILQDPDYEFNGRTAVDWYYNSYTAYIKKIANFDMKDRFRVCYPGDAPKTRKSKQGKASKEKQSDTTPKISITSDLVKATKANKEVEMEQHTKEQQGEPVKDATQTTLTELGIHGPFPKSTRRPKRPFNAIDDKNLLIGFEKHGPVWHSIRDDPELGFTTRHPTDLRDRFRIKYPDRYAKAGYKLKPKEERILEEQSNKRIEQEQQQQQQQSKAVSEPTKDAMQVTYRGGPDAQFTPSAERGQSKPHLSTTMSTTTTSAPLNSSSLKSYMPFLFDATLFGDDALSSDGDADGSRSPITLNRNILQWADANPSSLSAFPAPPSQTYPNYSAAAAADTSVNWFATHDGIHINPLATIKLPPATSYTSSASLVTNAPSSSTAAGPAGDARMNMSMTMSMSMNISSGSANMPTSVPSSMYPRTPNLPTIVFPHVPAASARSAMHNLPTPADLLLGIEFDRGEQGITLDDALGLTMP